MLHVGLLWHQLRNLHCVSVVRTCPPMQFSGRMNASRERSWTTVPSENPVGTELSGLHHPLCQPIALRVSQSTSDIFKRISLAKSSNS